MKSGRVKSEELRMGFFNARKTELSTVIGASKLLFQNCNISVRYLNMNLRKSKRHNYCTVNVTMIVLF